MKCGNYRFKLNEIVCIRDRGFAIYMDNTDYMDNADMRKKRGIIRKRVTSGPYCYYGIEIDGALYYWFSEENLEPTLQEQQGHSG